ncbi:MAG: VTT domain-containing protein [Oscillospiraceae bacterium]|nr:VTT domain-containing protein [Oscillospiraceae bacterium]
MQQTMKRLVKILLPILTLSFTGLLIALEKLGGLEKLQVWSGNHTAAAILLIMALYALKSLSVFFPLTALYCLTALSFSLPTALLLNFMGLTVCVTLPYCVGNLLSFDFVNRLKGRYPKFAVIESLQQNGSFQLSILTRVVGMLPGDLVSIYFGTVKLPFWFYLSGSLLGLAPAMITETILGKNITAPFSQPFLIAVLVRLLIAIMSLVSCRKLLKSK